MWLSLCTLGSCNCNLFTHMWLSLCMLGSYNCNLFTHMWLSLCMLGSYNCNLFTHMWLSLCMLGSYNCNLFTHMWLSLCMLGSYNCNLFTHMWLSLCMLVAEWWYEVWKIYLLFSCGQAALWMVQSVRLSVHPSVRPSVCVCHTFFTMFPSSYHHEIFRSYYYWQKWCPCKRLRSEVKGQGHRDQNPT